MGKVTSYKDLIAWQRAMELVEAVYRLSALFPKDERFGLTAQIRRAAVSVASDIAEGHSRLSRDDYIRFLNMATGSENEVETQALIAVRLRFVTEKQAERALGLAPEVQRIVRGLTKSLARGTKSRVGMQ